MLSQKSEFFITPLLPIVLDQLFKDSVILYFHRLFPIHAKEEECRPLRVLFVEYVFFFIFLNKLVGGYCLYCLFSVIFPLSVKVVKEFQVKQLNNSSKLFPYLSPIIYGLLQFLLHQELLSHVIERQNIFIFVILVKLNVFLQVVNSLLVIVEHER